MHCFFLSLLAVWHLGRCASVKLQKNREPREQTVELKPGRRGPERGQTYINSPTVCQEHTARTQSTYTAYRALSRSHDPSTAEEIVVIVG